MPIIRPKYGNHPLPVRQAQPIGLGPEATALGARLSSQEHLEKTPDLKVQLFPSAIDAKFVYLGKEISTVRLKILVFQATSF